MRLSASQLGSWARCPRQWYYEKIEKREGEGLSATHYGSVIHHALHAFERQVADAVSSGTPVANAVDAALTTALATFDYYWHPSNLDQITGGPVTVWIRGDSYGSLRQKGLNTLRMYAEVWRADRHQLLSLEHPFEVVVPGTLDEQTGQPHTISGFVDRLTIRWKASKPMLDTDDWKGLALDTLLPTPEGGDGGYVRMGDVWPGQPLFGSNGRPCLVTAVSEIHQRPCFRLTFDDATTVVCDDEHRWAIRRRSVGRRLGATQVLEARELHVGDLIENARPLDGSPDFEFGYHSSGWLYVAGAWLGDGTNHRPVISKPDQDLYDLLELEGVRFGADHSSRTNTQQRTFRFTDRARQNYFAKRLGWDKELLIKDLCEHGNWADNLALLQGLMDTDGTWNKVRNQAVFTSTNRDLAELVQRLVYDLGVNARLWPLTKYGFGKTITAYDVTFTPVGFNPFRLPRKRDLVVVPQRHKATRRVLVGIEKTLTVPTRCLTVDSPDSTYLVGTTNLVTHNTGKRKTFLRHHIGLTVYAFASTRPEFWEPFAAQGFDPAEMHAAYADLPRHVTWYDLKTFERVDAGFRGEQDYRRMAVAVQEMARSVQAGIFPLRIEGDICTYCPFNKICPDGSGLPDETHGALA